MSGLPGYDAWATGGRYSRELLVALCPECEEWSPVTAESEYGATTWTPEECPRCGAEWPEDARTELDEPPEPDRDDLRRPLRRPARPDGAAMTTAAVGRRFRIVTEQNGSEHVSSIVLARDEIIEHIAIEADMHEATGWDVSRFALNGLMLGFTATRGGCTRYVFGRSFTPHTDTPEGGTL